MTKDKALVSEGRVERAILLIRGEKVILDAELAELYGVTAKRLNEQVKRNRSRFPEDFMFQLTWEETRSLRSQIATLDDPRADGLRSRPSPSVGASGSTPNSRDAGRHELRLG